MIIIISGKVKTLYSELHSDVIALFTNTLPTIDHNAIRKKQLIFSVKSLTFWTSPMVNLCMSHNSNQLVIQIFNIFPYPYQPM